MKNTNGSQIRSSVKRIEEGDKKILHFSIHSNFLRKTNSTGK